MRVWAHVGVAAALSIAGWVQALTLLAVLSRRGHFRLDGRARAQPAAYRRGSDRHGASCW